MKSIIFIMITLLLLQLGTALDIGVTPSGVDERQLLPGSTLEKEFFISRYDTLSKTMLEINTQGNASEWLTIKLEKEAMEGEEKEIRMNVAITVPEKILLGQYEATVQVRAKIENEKGTINTEIVIPLTFHLVVIDEEVKKYNVVGITIDEHTEESPLPLHFIMINKGNVPATLTEVRVVIMDKYKTTTIDTYNTQIEESVEPFSRKEITITIPTALTHDQYWARVLLYENDDLKGEEEIIFDIQEKRSNEQEKRNIKLWQVVAILLVGVIIIKVIINRRKRKL